MQLHGGRAFDDRQQEIIFIDRQPSESAIP